MSWKDSRKRTAETFWKIAIIRNENVRLGFITLFFFKYYREKILLNKQTNRCEKKDFSD